MDNLKSARELGVRTAWVTQYLRGSQALLGHMGGQRALSRLPGFVDVKVRSVRQLPRRLAALGAAR